MGVWGVSEFDAIVVGAGHNSLACAAHLALKGWKIGIFERNSAVGGAVQTRELTLPGFRHDLGAMNSASLPVPPFTGNMQMN